MGKGKAVGIGIIVIILLTCVSGYLFYVKTGGRGLTRAVWYYFWRDIPDKKYSWREFSDRGVEQGISGFYAFGSETSFSMWTLAGLKTFYHVAGTSIYQYEDICGALKRLRDNPNESGASGMRAEARVSGELAVWEGWIKPENLVTVVRLREGDGKNMIDKVWSYSGKYKVLNRLDEGVCD